MQQLRDAAIRVKLGISLDTVAELAGVTRQTLTRFELEPTAVKSESKRARLAALYKDLRAIIERAEARRA